jgi:hypothetical protein
VIPTLEEYQSGSTSWKGTYRSVSYVVTHWGPDRKYSPYGTWCYYIFIHKEMFINIEDWKLFDIDELSDGYSVTPDLNWHCGITFGEKLNEGTVKLGCDYNHYYDEDLKNWYSLDIVTQDTKVSIDTFHDNFKLKLRCDYSGKWDIPENFYKAKNGATVHISWKEKLAQNGWDTWLPEDN